MQDLKVIGVESGALLVATDAGSEFRLPVTLSLQSQLRQATPGDPTAAPVAPKVSPRAIQASIRAGRTAQQVADETGAELDYIRRFEGPVIDERAFVLDTARAVPVSVAGRGASEEPFAEPSRFGDVIDSRLDESDASERVWSAFKDAALGWIVRVTYTTSEVERDAAWRFEPKKQSLAPHAGDAHTLSRQDADHANLVPRLRAVSTERDASTPVDDLDDAGARFGDTPFDSARFDSARFDSDRSEGARFDSARSEGARFDSGAFEPLPEGATPEREPASTSASARAREGWSAAPLAAMNRAPESDTSHNKTADLLEALRRRRGERETARFDDDSETSSRAAHPSTGSIRVVDVPLDDFDGDASGDSAPVEAPRIMTKPLKTQPLATHPTANRPPANTDATGDAPRSAPTSADQRQKSAQGRGRKGRAAMPSWDEIVFGARSDDDPA